MECAPPPNPRMLSTSMPPTPTDLSTFKVLGVGNDNGGLVDKSPNRTDNSSPSESPSSSPPSSVPMSMVSMASILSRPPPNFPGFPAPPGYPQGLGLQPFAKDFPGHQPHPGYPMIQRPPYSRSPPPMVSPNDPTANDCKIVEYRGEKIAAFMINNKTMLCLPQAFELFLKNLVGGLHTVYTKCKRLEVQPMICNVEQVRVLRGLGAIQPGVNRCKLIADTDFDSLYKDCTTSRPPKRVMPFPAMSPQDAMLHLHGGHPHHNQGPPLHPHSSPLTHNGSDSKSPSGMFHGHNSATSPGSGVHSPVNSLFPNDLKQRVESVGFPSLPGLPSPHQMAGMPHAALMSLNNIPGAAQAALMSRSGVPGLPGLPALSGLPGLPPLPGLQGVGSPQAMLESYKQNYGDMIKHLQGLQKTYDIDRDDMVEKEDKEHNGSVLNLSQSSVRDSIRSGASSDLCGDDKNIESDDEDMDIKYEDKSSTNIRDDEKSHPESEDIQKSGSMFQMMNHIQSLISKAVENAKKEEKSCINQKSDLKGELEKEKETQAVIRKKIDEETKSTDNYLRRFRKEKKLRRKLQDQLESETRKIQALEATLRSVSYDTLVRVKEKIAREAAMKESLGRDARNSGMDAEADEKNHCHSPSNGEKTSSSYHSPANNNEMYPPNPRITHSTSPGSNSHLSSGLPTSLAQHHPPQINFNLTHLDAGARMASQASSMFPLPPSLTNSSSPY